MMIVPHGDTPITGMAQRHSERQKNKTNIRTRRHEAVTFYGYEQVNSQVFNFV